MDKIMIENVRLSFPALFHKATYNGKESKFEATFLIPKKDVKTKKKLDRAIKQIIKESTVNSVPKDRICIRDGDSSEFEQYRGYPGNWSLKASSKKRPLVIGRMKDILTEEDEIVYAGCYVNGIVDFWVQDNQFGKRVNANLFGVQFVEDGDHLAAGGENVMDEFNELESDEEYDIDTDFI